MMSDACYTNLQNICNKLSYLLAWWGYVCHSILLHAQQLLQLLHPLLPPLHLCKQLFQYFNLPINPHPFFFCPDLGKGPTSWAIFTLEHQQLAMILCQRGLWRDGDKHYTKWFGTFVHCPLTSLETADMHSVPELTELKREKEHSTWNTHHLKSQSWVVDKTCVPLPSVPVILSTCA